MFCSRWNPHTKSAEIVDCVNDILQGQNCDDIKYIQLKSKYEHLYSSFYVCVSVPSSAMRESIDMLMSADAWPTGTLVRRYYPPKDNDG